MEGKKSLGNIPGVISIVANNFYYSLILTKLYPTASEPEKQNYTEKIQTNQKRMKNWADNCSENFFHKYLLVEAELACLSGNYFEAIDYYDRAILGAKENEYIQGVPKQKLKI